MTAGKGPDDRVMLPRWRAWRGSQSSGELQSLRQGAVVEDRSTVGKTAEDELVQRLDEFARWRGIYEAADVVSTAIVLGLEDFPGVHDAAELVYSSSLSAGKELAERILFRSRASSSDIPQALELRLDLGPSESLDKDRIRVARLRRLLQRQPRNALRWADLALAQTMLNNHASAAKAMRVALSLANGNRFILRAAARFHVHEGDLDAARSVLAADVARLFSDPWLMAAEIAITDLSGRPIHHVSRARRLLDGDFKARHVSELASALATVELKAGRGKLARRLFERALEDPTENTVAQTEWSVDRGVSTLPPVQAKPPLNFEAEARHMLRQGEFEDATVQLRLWQEDQPFAADPALYVSYVAATFAEDYDAAIRACEKGLRANPDNVTLLNNLAFSQASLGRVIEASKTMERLPSTDAPRELLVLTATRGLIAFRQGNLEEGRRLYQESILGWQKDQKDSTSAARAAIHWTREEARAGTDHAVDALAVAARLCEHASDDPGIKILHRRLICQ